jgi:hypothetical protein
MNHRFAEPKNYFFMRRRIKAIPLRQRREVKAGSGIAAGGTEVPEIEKVRWSVLAQIRVVLKVAVLKEPT